MLSLQLSIFLSIFQFFQIFSLFGFIKQNKCIKITSIAFHFINTGREYNQQKLKTENGCIKLIQSADLNEKQPTETNRTETEKSQTQGCNA